MFVSDLLPAVPAAVVLRPSEAAAPSERAAVLVAAVDHRLQGQGEGQAEAVQGEADQAEEADRQNITENQSGNKKSATDRGAQSSFEARVSSHQSLTGPPIDNRAGGGGPGGG